MERPFLVVSTVWFVSTVVVDHHLLDGDVPFLGLCRRWRFDGKVVGSAFRNVRFQVFRVATFRHMRSVVTSESRHSTSKLIGVHRQQVKWVVVMNRLDTFRNP